MPHRGLFLCFQAIDPKPPLPSSLSVNGNSPQQWSYISPNVSYENLVLDQMIIPW